MLPLVIYVGMKVEHCKKNTYGNPDWCELAGYVENCAIISTPSQLKEPANKSFIILINISLSTPFHNFGHVQILVYCILLSIY